MLAHDKIETPQIPAGEYGLLREIHGLSLY
jgi:hypothetical protein